MTGKSTFRYFIRESENGGSPAKCLYGRQPLSFSLRNWVS